MICPSCNRNESLCISTSSTCQQCGYRLESYAAYLLLHMKEGKQHCSMITSLPDSLLMVVTSYLDPPDVYSLAQTCTQFHTPSAELSTRHYLLSPQFEPLEFLQNNGVTNLASRLLQESLVQGFTSVIQTAMSINDARRIVKFQSDELSIGRKVLLSGSAAVQAVTGKRFERFDLNFFCNRQSVSGFRQLMRDLGYCCESVLLPYSDVANECYFRDGRIHHVETFIPRGDIETVAISTLLSEYYRAWNAQLAAIEADEEVPQEHIDMSFLNQRNVDLYKIQRRSDTFHTRFPRDYPIALTPRNNYTGSVLWNLSLDSGARNKCKNGSIQLVVSSTCPMLAIAKYDMDICKSSFDGRHVHLVSISDTFNFQTKSDEHFMKFINFYVPQYLSRTNYGVNSNLTTVSFTEATREEILHILYSLLKTAEIVDRHMTAEDSHPTLLLLSTHSGQFFTSFLNGETLNSMQIDLLAMDILLLHNNIVRVLQCALKYFERGIDVPLSDNVKVLLGYSTNIHQHDEEDMFAQPPTSWACNDHDELILRSIRFEFPNQNWILIRLIAVKMKNLIGKVIYMDSTHGRLNLS